jgi:hypothetical protein
LIACLTRRHSRQTFSHLFLQLPLKFELAFYQVVCMISKYYRQKSRLPGLLTNLPTCKGIQYDKTKMVEQGNDGQNQ